MSALEPGFAAHLATGLTTLCNAWAITRSDGVVLGFTDHDCALSFEGIAFRADSGLTARALQQSTGLSVDNTEALGALSDEAIREEDIAAGRFDAAEVRSWLVNWADVSQRALQFRGQIGEIRRGDGAFHAELRGLADLLNQPQGRVYHRPCSAVLGDAACGFDLGTPGYRLEALVETIEGARAFGFEDPGGFEPGWFEKGRFAVLDGAADGLIGVVKRDTCGGGQRFVELWEPIPAEVAPGDMIRIDAGCDKRMETCKLKFGNLLNFQGFPDIPGEDWMMASPVRAGSKGGGSRR